MQVAVPFVQAMNLLGVFHNFRNAMSTARSLEQAAGNLEQVKALATKRFKKLARSYHPDMGGSDHAMHWLNNAVELINQMRINRPQPRPQPPIHFNCRVQYYSHTVTTTTTGSTTGTTNGFSRVFYRNR